MPISTVSSAGERGEYGMVDAPEEDLLGKVNSTFRRGDSGEMMCSPFPVEVEEKKWSGDGGLGEREGSLLLG